MSPKNPAPLKGRGPPAATSPLENSPPLDTPQGLTVKNIHTLVGTVGKKQAEATNPPRSIFQITLRSWMTISVSQGNQAVRSSLTPARHTPTLLWDHCDHNLCPGQESPPRRGGALSQRYSRVQSEPKNKHHLISVANMKCKGRNSVHHFTQ